MLNLFMEVTKWNTCEYQTIAIFKLGRGDRRKQSSAIEVTFKINKK